MNSKPPDHGVVNPHSVIKPACGSGVIRERSCSRASGDLATTGAVDLARAALLAKPILKHLIAGELRFRASGKLLVCRRLASKYTPDGVGNLHGGSLRRANIERHRVRDRAGMAGIEPPFAFRHSFHMDDELSLSR
jgi:hypothetical protein